MKIGIDAMGGDRAPSDIVCGAVTAVQEANGRFEVVLIGDETKIKNVLRSHRRSEELPILIHHASQYVDMNESPSLALKRKKDSSIAVCMQLHKEKKIDAVVSAGNTGAVLATALVSLRKIEGVIRPAIGSLLPNGKGATLLIDAGTNVDCKPVHLLQFGIMGSIFYSKLFSKKFPVVGLLSIGEEESKGNELTQKAHSLLKQSQLNFVGNIEGGDILRGKVDVVVCDGFVGNIILKFAESFNRIYSSNLRKCIGNNISYNLGAFLLKPAVNELRKTFDYAEYGGVPMLGVNGVCIICHGSSSPKAIKNAILEAEKIINEKVNEHIGNKLKALSEEKIAV